MKKEHLITGGGLILLFIIIYFFTEKQKREKELDKSRERESQLHKENSALKNMMTDLTNEVEEIIENKEELSGDVKSQLKALIDKYKDIDQEVTNELTSISLLLEIKEEVKAIAALTNVIENLLKKIYVDDPELKPNAKLFALIDHAKKKHLIVSEEYHFLYALKQIRNESVHQLAVRKSRNIVESSILIGITMIFKLAMRVKN